ncbi:MAG: hypothetical protein HZC24_10745 [Rhodocyclales bacterium]|nr:hypothetical protein [Rhodocyclales bacterium]
MAKHPKHPQFPPPLSTALAWLAAPPAADPLRDLNPLRKHLTALAALGIPPLQHLKLLELFQERADLVAAALKSLLLDATLPVAKHLRIVAIGLANVHESLTAGYLACLREIPPASLHNLPRCEADLAAAGLTNLSQQFEIVHLVSAPLTSDFWLRACAVFGSAGTDPAPGAHAARLQMKSLLALAAVQPEGFAPRELAFLASYLRLQGAAVEIREASAAHYSGDFWLDPLHGKDPAAGVRLPPTPDATLFYSCAALSRVAGQHLYRLEQGARPEDLGLPPEASAMDNRHALALAAERWLKPRRRQNPRRAHGHRVQLCTRIETLWSGTDDAAATVSDWMIVNEGPGGYAVMHVAGELAGIVAGSAVGMRSAPDKPWGLCVVRWAHSENPEHIEFGLELLAAQAEPVRIARRDAAAAQLPALLLPALPALQRGEALLLAKGCFSPGRFTLIEAGNGRVRVAECSSGSLVLHTACIELFEFVRDFSAT